MTKIAIAIAAAGLCAGLWDGLCAPLGAQWLNYPTPGIPRTRDGKPNLSAPAPRAANGKPDLSGLWEPSTAGETRACCRRCGTRSGVHEHCSTAQGPFAVSA
jgi:hypothetical protein